MSDCSGCSICIEGYEVPLNKKIKPPDCIELPCLHCGIIHRFALDSNEANGIFNVFCKNGECEDKYAFSL